MPSDRNERWRTWDGDQAYGDLLYQRATGALPEMESSKALARRVAKLWQPGDNIMDVGCGAGHYLVSLRREIKDDFDYAGVDATAAYIELAQKAFADDQRARFGRADIYNLSFTSASFDIVVCSNVLPCLPDIVKPLRELVRVARKTVLIRFLCSDRTYLIRDVHPHDADLDDSGEPYLFNYLNIYSRRYVDHILNRMADVAGYTIEDDREFAHEAIGSALSNDRPDRSATGIVGGYQVSGCILLPWSFLTVHKKS